MNVADSHKEEQEEEMYSYKRSAVFSTLTKKFEHIVVNGVVVVGSGSSIYAWKMANASKNKNQKKSVDKKWKWKNNNDNKNSKQNNNDIRSRIHNITYL